MRVENKRLLSCRHHAVIFTGPTVLNGTDCVRRVLLLWRRLMNLNESFRSRLHACVHPFWTNDHRVTQTRRVLTVKHAAWYFRDSIDCKQQLLRSIFWLASGQSLKSPTSHVRNAFERSGLGSTFAVSFKLLSALSAYLLARASYLYNVSETKLYSSFHNESEVVTWSRMVMRK